MSVMTISRKHYYYNFSEVLPFRTLCPDREQLSILFFSSFDRAELNSSLQLTTVLTKSCWLFIFPRPDLFL